MAAKIISWDWKEQPDLADIAAAVLEMSGGLVHMRAVETGSDSYQWVISDHPVDDTEALRLDAELAEDPEVWGTLTFYDTGQPIRPATADEWERSDRLARSGADGSTGTWLYDGADAALTNSVVYVDGGPS
jgi:hypothetical protein